MSQLLLEHREIFSSEEVNVEQSFRDNEPENIVVKLIKYLTKPRLFSSI